jgi:hypothetical protein
MSSTSTVLFESGEIPGNVHGMGVRGGTLGVADSKDAFTVTVIVSVRLNMQLFRASLAPAPVPAVIENVLPSHALGVPSNMTVGFARVGWENILASGKVVSAGTVKVIVYCE